MKLETPEQELLLLKRDMENLRNEANSNSKEIFTILDKLYGNLEVVMNKLQLNIRDKYTCSQCEGYGTIYISPISDCGQDNKCTKCCGKGYYWI